MLKKNYNGYYDKKTNTIVIDVRAGVGTKMYGMKDAIIPTLSHELTHWMKQKSPELYAELSKTIFNVLEKKDGLTEHDRIALEIARYKEKHNGKELSADAARDEIIARACEDLFAMSEEGRKIFNSLSEAEQKTLRDKIKDIIKNLVDWVNELLGTYESKSYEAEALRDFKEELLETSKLWDKMLVSSVDVNAALETEGTTGEALANEATTDAQMSERETITQADIDVLRSIGRKSINEFTSEDIKKAEPFARRMWIILGVKSPFFRSFFGDWRANDTKTKITVAKIPEYIGTNEDRKKNRGIVLNDDTGWNINISREGETNTISHSGKDRLSEFGLSGIRELIESSILLDSEVHEHHSNNAKVDLITFDHKLYALGKSTDGSIALYKITVEEFFQSKREPDNKKFHNLKYIEKVADVGGRTSENTRSGGSTNDISATKYSISDLFQLVKTYDKEFKPKEPSKVVNDDGTPKVVYHSTNEKFTIFDITKSRSWDGTPDYDLPGFYFSENYDDSAAYGGNAGEYYIKITNPYEGDIYSLKKELGSFRKAYEYLIEHKYDGVIDDELGEGSYEYIVLKPENIKSATDNIGTFDSGNEDIQFSERDYSYNSLVAKPDMKLTLVGENVPSNRADIVHQAIINAKSVGYTNENGNAVVRVYDIKTDVIVPKKSIVHGLDRRMSSQAPVMIKIGEVLKNAIRINELVPRSENAKNTYVLIGSAVNKTNELYIASFVVNRFTNEVAEIDVLYSANAKKESAALLPKITDKSATPTDSAISIADLLEYVNRYFPDILPESVLRHYGHTERPDGTLGESVLFSERDYGTSAYDLVGEYKTLEKRYKQLAADFENYKERVKLDKTLTKGRVMQKSELEAVARFLVKHGDSNYNVSELAKVIRYSAR